MTRFAWAGYARDGVLALLALAACVYYARGELLDDPYISFRYSENLAAGNGLVFNPGERVEGYTNFLWVLLLAAVSWLGLDVALASRILGTLFAVGTVLVAAHFAPAPERAPWPRLVAPALLAINPLFSMWAVLGLETAMFTFWAALGLRDDFRATDTDQLPRWSGVWYALATLTRPEGSVFFAASAVGLALAGPTRWLSVRAVRHLGVYALIVGAHLGWRLAYYGDLLPNTAYAKVGLSAAVLIRGLAYVASYFSLATAGLFLLLISAAIAAIRERRLRLLWTVLVAFLAAVAAEGGDFFPGFRLLVPVFPALYVLAQEGLVRLVSATRPIPTPWVPRTVVGVAIVLAAVHLSSLRAQAKQLASGADHFMPSFRQVGVALRRSFPPGTSIAVNAAGAIPYYSGFRAYDMLGLTDRHIARRQIPAMGRGYPGHEKGDGRYILARRPDLILMGNVVFVDSPSRPVLPVPFRPVGVSEEELARDPEFPRLYVQDAMRLGEGRWLVFFRRRDVAPPGS